MAEAVIADYVTPSQEIRTSDGSIDPSGLLGEVSLYNLYDERDAPEQDAERIFDITYPTETLTAIIENTARKLDGDADFSEGGQIVGGEYGSGKSHIELVVYHLFNSPDIGQRWLDQRGIDVELPDKTRTAALQMFNLDKSYNRLSEAVGDYLGIDRWADGTDLPKVHEIREALEDEPTLVLIDELERWFGMANRAEYEADNLAFLQNLLEAAGRDDTCLSVFVSLLYENEDVQAITQRTNPFTHDLSSRRDEKIDFILHRLIGSVDDADGVAALAKEYTDVYRQNDQIQLDDYHDMQERIERYYPFHPLLLNLLMEKYSEQRASSDARGLLRLLTVILRDNISEVDFILPGDVDVFSYTDRFKYTDGELVGKYVDDYHRLQKPDETFDEFHEQLLNIVLLHSLVRAGEEGANKRQMLMGTMRKGVNAHGVIRIFSEEVYGHAWHIHRSNGEYAFDVDENPAARIEKKAQDIHKHDAIHRVESLIREDLFDRRTNVHILDPVNTERNIPDSKALKVVVSLGAKRNYDEDFEKLTTGQNREYNNTLVLVTPDKRSGVDTNTGIIELARKVVVGEMLAEEEDVLPEGFDGIHDRNYRSLRDRVRDKYGTVHTSTERGLFPQDLPAAGNRDCYAATVEVVEPDSSQLRSEVKNVVKGGGAKGIQYEHLKNDFYRNPKFTTLTGEDELEDAIDSLRRDGVIEAGNCFEEHVGSLGSDTSLLHEQYIEEEGDEGEDESTIFIETSETPSKSPKASNEGSTAVKSGGEPQLITRTLDADNKPDIVDALERELGLKSAIHEAEITVDGTLTADELSGYGIGASALRRNVSLEETFTIAPDEPMNKRSLLGLVTDLRVPERASLSVELAVDEGE